MQTNLIRIPFKRNGLRGAGLLHANPIFAQHGWSANFVERFWNFVRKTDHCWLWIGNKNEKGYGLISIGKQNGTPFKAHRASWIIHFGTIPEGKCMLHDCRPLPDCPYCVNPSHLWLGSVLDNNSDMDIKGVHVPPPHLFGENSSKASLTQKQADEIRELHRAGVQYSHLAKQFKVHLATIGRVVRHETY